ncbi:MAG: hypothetical protein ACYTA5_04180 [Planctomycetota bacterium]
MARRCLLTRPAMTVSRLWHGTCTGASLALGDTRDVAFIAQGDRLAVCCDRLGQVAVPYVLPLVGTQGVPVLGSLSG